MKNYLFIIISCFLAGTAYSQGINCDEVYSPGSPCHRACQMICGEDNGDRRDYQGSRESQMWCDSAIALCPSFAEAYYVKSIPYLKRGEIITWKQLIDKAVENETGSHYYLGYRGGTRFMFLRDYEGAIRDIELLKTKVSHDIGSIYNGEYHLEVIRALSYRGIGNTLKAIEIMENHLSNYGYAGLFDYFHLGVMFYQLKNYEAAEKALNKEIELNDYFADTYYYMALVKRAQGDENTCTKNLKKATEFYLQGKSVRGLDSYMDYPDKVYLQQIKEAVGKE